MNVCFNGCSFTVGEGFPVEQRESYIYDRLLEKQHGFARTNIARGGSSNYTIFMRSASAVISGDYDCVITQWSALNRLWLHPGPDAEFSINDSDNDFVYRNIHISKQQKIKLKDTLLMLNGDYQNIIDLVKFCEILENLAQAKNVKIAFVNGLVPWTDDLIQPLGTDLGQSLSAYSKELLDFDHRDDHEIHDLFQQLQQNFSRLNQNLWVNLFDSFQKNIRDQGPEGHHPGIRSHQWMADKLSNFLTQNNLL